MDRPSTSLVIVITEVAPLSRCLAAVDAQTLPPCETIVCCAAADEQDVARTCRETGASSAPRLLVAADATSSEEVRAAGARTATGEVIAFTESHCFPAPDWLQKLADIFARTPAVAAGGTVEQADHDATLAQWAFHFCDYYPFQAPQADRDASNLTDCNVAYRRDALDALDVDWRRNFHVWSVNDRLRGAGGTLRLDGDAVVLQRRSVSGRDAARESFGHGMLFAERRIQGLRLQDRAKYAAGGLLLAPLLIGRICAGVVRSGRHLGRFVTALPWVVAYTTSWSAGEFLGYLRGVARPRPAHPLTRQ